MVSSKRHAEILDAAAKGDTANVLSLVLGAGADPRVVQAVDNQGCTAVWLAASHGNTETVRALVNECHADVKTDNKDGITPILIAACNGHTTTVRALVNECGADATEY
jgi:ankyrin repeat protein